MARTNYTAPTRGGGSAYELANQKALERETEIRGLLDKLVGQWQPGSAYLQGLEKQLVGAGTQANITSGLFGTTAQAGLQMGARARLEDIRQQGYTSALGQKINFINSIQENVPSYETLANLTAKSQTATPSLASYLAQNFAVPKATTTPKPQTGQTAEAMQRIKEALEAKKYPSIKYAAPSYGTSSYTGVK